jgi:putative membrane protein
MYNYLKALHIIFVVTWFAGLFYMPRLFIYSTEAGDKPTPAKEILREQFKLMSKRLWMGITWPSAILTLVLGPWMWIQLGVFPQWLLIKLIFVLGLYAYHFSIHIIYRQQQKGIYKFSSQQLRLWNEAATVFLFAIVFIAVVKNSISWIWAMVSLIALIIVLMAAVKIYKHLRSRSK